MLLTPTFLRAGDSCLRTAGVGSERCGARVIVTRVGVRSHFSCFGTKLTLKRYLDQLRNGTEMVQN
jgi:hypothetical protein